MPDLIKPTQLFFSRAAEVNFRNRKRQPVSFPCLSYDCFRSGHAFRTAPDCLPVGVYVTAIPAVKDRGISIDTLIEKALARYVVVEAQQIRAASIFQEPFQLARCDTQPTKVIPHRRARSDSTT